MKTRFIPIVILTMLICSTAFSAPGANTTLPLLDTFYLNKARFDSPSVSQYANGSIEQFAYYLGKKEYGFGYRYAPIGVAVITPYSLARYGFFKESQIYRDFTPGDQKMLLDNNDTVFVVTYPAGAYTAGYPASVQNVVIKTKGEVFKPINSEITLQSKWNLPGTWWAFPIGLFTAKADIEIVVIDEYDNVMPLKVSGETIARLQ